MPHQCVHCSKFYADGAEELLSGCSCGSKFFFYINKKKYEQLKNENALPMINLNSEEKEQIEKDVREIVGVREEKPVILDLESIKVLKPGKFELDIVKLFNKKRPVVYKLEEGKYIIDLKSTLKGVSKEIINKNIVEPSESKSKKKK